jgi:hypothetical protein
MLEAETSNSKVRVKLFLELFNIWGGGKLVKCFEQRYYYYYFFFLLVSAVVSEAEENDSY